jgi:hypothetical protein
MGLPVRTHIVHFSQSLEMEQLKNSLCKLTGLSLSFEDIKMTTYTPSGVEIWNQRWPKHFITVDWIIERNGVNVRVWSETPHINYLEASTLYLLKQLGGKFKETEPLPSWVGKEWVDVRPRSPLAKIKAWLNGKLPP